MIVHVLSALAIAGMSVLFAWAIYRTIKRPMPKALIPILAAMSAIAYGIYSEYTWAERTLEQMPESIVVIQEFKSKSMFSPWSYLVPRVDRLSLLDTHAIRQNPQFSQLKIIDFLIMQRYSPVVRARQLIDCSQLRRADLTMDQQFDGQGMPLHVQWESLDVNHALIQSVCKSEW